MRHQRQKVGGRRELMIEINWQQYPCGYFKNGKIKIILDLFSQRLKKKCQTTHPSAQWGIGERQNGENHFLLGINIAEESGRWQRVTLDTPGLNN